MLRTRTPVFVLFLALTAMGTGAVADADPFRDADPISDIGLARLADEAGDSVLAAALSASDARERTLLALRSAPFAAAPEQLIPLLVPLALGRDPQLAPEAAWALAAIGEGLRPSGLAAREVLLSELSTASKAIEQIKEARVVRADITANLEGLAANWAVLSESAANRAPKD